MIEADSARAVWVPDPRLAQTDPTGRSSGREALYAGARAILPRSAERNQIILAIKADTEPGLEKWLSLNAEYAKVWPNITVKKPPPPDSKEWEGKPDKLQYFSPNPGAGD